MARCIELAKKGIGYVAPNPMVGCVIVHNDQVIGEGYHQKFGEAHAEVNAINSVANKELLKESTIIVSLEPCSHYGKTPPCSDLIIEKQIPKVVIGTVDPFAEVAGRGIEKLKKAGRSVKVGVLENECQELNKRFFTFHRKRRPYIILKWAQTQDGFIDVERDAKNYGQPTWITNELARKHVHKTRANESSILVGKNTVLKDNPTLTVRDWIGENPIRIVLDRNLELPVSLNLFNSDSKTIVFNAKRTDKRKHLSFECLDYTTEIVPQIIDNLYQKEIQSLIVEGGSLTLQKFIDLDLWDEAHIYHGPVFFKKGISAPKLEGILIETMNFGNSYLEIFRNTK